MHYFSRLINALSNTHKEDAITIISTTQTGNGATRPVSYTVLWARRRDVAPDALHHTALPSLR